MSAQLLALRECLDTFEGRYSTLKRGARTFGEYVATPSKQADEQTLTEPILGLILERVLGFPTGAYFPQLGKSGLKPDLTPIDLIAHPFVLDAKGSNEGLGSHVRQIQGYVNQRSLKFGVLFNLREFRVYPRTATKQDASVSFPLLPLWQVARGEALPVPRSRRSSGFALLFPSADSMSRRRSTTSVTSLRGRGGWSTESRSPWTSSFSSSSCDSLPA